MDTKENATVRIPAKPAVEKGQNQDRMQRCGCPCVPCMMFSSSSETLEQYEVAPI